MKTCLILAAGEGSRISSKISLKPLIPLLGIPLIERQIQTFSQAGVEEFVIVNGYKGKELTSFLDNNESLKDISIKHIENPDWPLGNGTSLLAASDYLKHPFLLTMSDHIYDPQIVSHFIQQNLGEDKVILAVDTPRPGNKHLDLEDVTKVQIDEDRIIQIGKNLKTYQVYDTGLFMCDSALFEGGHNDQKGDYSLSDAILKCAQQKKARIAHIPSLFWVDIDTEYDLETAARFLTEIGFTAVKV